MISLRRFLCFAVLLLSGVAVYSQDAPPVGATVYFYEYRMQALQIGKPTFPVVCDGKKIATLPPNTFFAFPLTQGKHTLTSSDRRNAIELDVHPGDVYYVRVDPYAPGIIVHGSLTLVLPEQGSAELAKTHPVPVKYLHTTASAVR
jgi:hypothetical protein